VHIRWSAPGKHPLGLATDNCYRDYAQVNARQLAEKLSA
jgi:hypothetical protein